MEVERKSKDQEEAHLSGAYIRGLVERLSCSQDQQHEVQQPQKLQRGSPKKQVRRRLHATRPYQERLFNMAEARREIVAALKLHRASMKQAHEPQSMAATSILQGRSHELVVDSIRNSINHPPDHALAKYFHASPFSSTYQLNFRLPDQPLGLNLNLQTFQNLDTSIYHSIHNPTPAEPSSSQALLSSCSNSSPNAMPGTKQSSHVAFDPSSVSLNQAIDEEEMAEIQSNGEQHDMEWNDKMNLATSAWWSKFLKSMEGGTDEGQHGANGDCIYAFGETLDMPYRLNGGVGEEARPYFNNTWMTISMLMITCKMLLSKAWIPEKLNMEENDYYSGDRQFDKGHLITAPSN